MKELTKENLSDFLTYYHKLHDSYITSVNYDINSSKIELLIDVCWSGEAILKEDNTYETNKTKIRIFFNKIEKFNCSEIFSWDYIDSIIIKYIDIENKEYITFSNNEIEPFIYIVCEKIQYEEIGKKSRKKL